MDLTATEEELLQKACRYRTVKDKIPAQTGPFAHKNPSRMIVLPAMMRGFTVTHGHDGGRWVRNLLIIIEGPAIEVVAFSISVDHMLKGLGTDAE